MDKLLFGHFLNKHEFSSEEDVHKIFNLLPFDTLNKAYLAWFDEKDDIVQAQIVKKEWNTKKIVYQHVNLMKKIIKLIIYKMISTMKVYQTNSLYW